MVASVACSRRLPMPALPNVARGPMSRVAPRCKRLHVPLVKRVYPPRPVPSTGEPHLLDRLTEVARSAVGLDADVVVARLERRWPDAESALRRVYGAELD